MITSQSRISLARFLFILVGMAVGCFISALIDKNSWYIGLTFGMAISSISVLIESRIKTVSFRGFSSATFGLMIGMFCAWLLSHIRVAEVLTALNLPEQTILISISVYHAAIYSILGYFGVLLALRANQDEFYLLIPYVRFREDPASGQTVILDIDICCDSRLARLLKSGFLTGRLVIPRFILDELQIMANSSNPVSKAKGQRGLSQLEELRETYLNRINIVNFEKQSIDKTIESNLILVAKELSARLLTLDDNLAKLATLQVVPVLNINELSEALRPTIMIGDRVTINLSRLGREDHQAVGYLPDGSMLVVNNASHLLGTQQTVQVSSAIQTSSGRMLFSELLPVD